MATIVDLVASGEPAIGRPSSGAARARARFRARAPRAGRIEPSGASDATDVAQHGFQLLSGVLCLLGGARRRHRGGGRGRAAAHPPSAAHARRRRLAQERRRVLRRRPAGYSARRRAVRSGLGQRGRVSMSNPLSGIARLLPPSFARPLAPFACVSMFRQHLGWNNAASRASCHRARGQRGLCLVPAAAAAQHPTWRSS